MCSSDLFVRLERDGRVGFGECAPLPGLHRESFDDCAAALERFASGACAADALPPAAQFAVSCAEAMLGGLGGLACEPAHVAAFFPGGVADLDAAVEHFADAPVIKLKIGRAGADDERALLRNACAAWPLAVFRVDGNRRLAFADCVERLRGIDPARIEYLEEPLADPADLPRLRAATGIAIALDELVADTDPSAALLRDMLSTSGAVEAWVLRLSCLGSVARARMLASAAASHGIDAVLSTAYESSFSLRFAVHLEIGRAHV